MFFLHLPWSEDFMPRWQLSDTRSIDDHRDDGATADMRIARHTHGRMVLAPCAKAR